MHETPRLLTIVVPVFNEADTLREQLGRLLKTDFPISVEVLVVDDGSTDGCIDLISDLVESGAVRLERHECNKGKGAAVRTGIALASGNLLTISDADLEYYPDDYIPVLQPILEEGARIVTAPALSAAIPRIRSGTSSGIGSSAFGRASSSTHG